MIVILLQLHKVNYAPKKLNAIKYIYVNVGKLHAKKAYIGEFIYDKDSKVQRCTTTCKQKGIDFCRSLALLLYAQYKLILRQQEG